MIDSIIIPTLGRSQNQMTFDNLPPNAQKLVTLVVQPKEKNCYPKYNTLVLPDDDIGITETRRWIYMNSMDIKYFVIDDDMKFIRRTPGEEKSKRPMNESDWDYLLNKTSDWLDDFAWGGFRQGNLPPSGKEYLESAAVNCAFFFNGKKLPDESELDWSLSTVEDISMVLQLFQKGYNNRVWDKFGYLSNYVGTEGGCAEWRTLDLINENHQKLINMYPQYVSWNGTKEILGGEFKKIKVKWKQAYLDSQKSKASLESFME
tara:strand:- start:48 stop:830 length:783 start_codon:yes stop_codon:yes gene_type:complete